MSDNIFLEIDGIKGESTSDQGKDMIQLLSFSHGLAMPLVGDNSNTSRTSGKCVMQDVTVSMYFDLATPTLNLKCSGGEVIKSMKIHMWKADAAGKPIEYVTYILDSCIITSVSVNAGSSQPLVTMTVNFMKITWEYNQQVQEKGGKSGKSQAIFDMSKNKKS